MVWFGVSTQMRCAASLESRQLAPTLAGIRQLDQQRGLPLAAVGHHGAEGAGAAGVWAEVRHGARPQAATSANTTGVLRSTVSSF